MKKLPVVLILIAAASLLLNACSPASTPAAAPAPSAARAQGLIAEGRLLPINTLDQSFKLSGQVAEVLVKDGETVKAGQALARLNDSPEAKAALARAQQETLAAQQALDALQSAAGVTLAQARLAYLDLQDKADQARKEADAKASDQNKARLDAADAAVRQAADALARLESGKGVNPDQQAAAQARLASANAAAASAQAALDALVLRSSVDGTIVDLTLQAGQQVSAGAPVMTVADFSQWLVKTDNLTEMAVTNVKVGQKVEVVLDALPGETLSAEVTRINARFEDKRGDVTYTVTVLLAQAAPQARWGMTAAVHFKQ